MARLLDPVLFRATAELRGLPCQSRRASPTQGLPSSRRPPLSQTFRPPFTNQGSVAPGNFNFWGNGGLPCPAALAHRSTPPPLGGRACQGNELTQAPSVTTLKQRKRESVQSRGWGGAQGGQGRCRASGAQRPVAGPQAGRAQGAWTSGSHRARTHQHPLASPLPGPPPPVGPLYCGGGDPFTELPLPAAPRKTPQGSGLTPKPPSLARSRLPSACAAGACGATNGWISRDAAPGSRPQGRKLCTRSSGSPGEAAREPDRRRHFGLA